MLRAISIKTAAALLLATFLFAGLSPAQAEHHEVTGIVTGTSPDFGNVWTDISTADFDALGVAVGGSVDVAINHGEDVAFSGTLPFVAGYGDVERGAPLIIHDDDLMTIAISFGNFTETHSIGAGDDWIVTITPAATD